LNNTDLNSSIMKIKLQSFVKPFVMTLGVLGIAAVATSAFAQLSTNSSEVAAGQSLTVTLNIPGNRAESGYFAIMFAGGIYFLDETGALSPYQPGVPTPRRLASGTQGQHTLFSMTIPAGLVGNADFYSAFGQSGVDVLATAGALDMSSLQHVSVALKEAASVVPDGRALYAQNCASCHGVNPLYNAERILNGRDAGKTKQAIVQDKGGMGYLNFLTDTEHTAIAAWISNPI
jgi:mono/diheme cytochrome c family protein